MLLKYIITLFLFLPIICYGASPSLLITEAQLATAESTKEEFVEIFNPAVSPIPLKNFKLIKKSKSGNESYLVSKFPDILLQSKQYYLIANPEYQKLNNFDLIYTNSSTTLAKDNNIFIIDENKSTMDSLGWGEINFNEMMSSPTPEENQSLERKKDINGNYIDTDNNLNDFFIQSQPNPQSTKDYSVIPALPIPEPEPLPPPPSIPEIKPDPLPIPQPPTPPAPTPEPTIPEIIPTPEIIITPAPPIPSQPAEIPQETKVNPAPILPPDPKVETVPPPAPAIAKEPDKKIEIKPPTTDKKTVQQKTLPKTTIPKNKTTAANMQGIISCAPDAIYKNVLYLEPEGIELRLPTNFSQNLKEGDRIKFQASLYNNEPQTYKLLSGSAISIVNSDNEIIPQNLPLKEISAKQKNKLIQTQGVVIEIKLNKVLITDIGELYIYFKNQNLMPTSLKEGDNLKITGILVYRDNELKLIPRYKNDVTLTPKSQDNTLNQNLIPIEDTPLLNLKNIIYGSLGLNFVLAAYFIGKKII